MDINPNEQKFPSQWYGGDGNVDNVWSKAWKLRHASSDTHRVDPYGNIIIRDIYGSFEPGGWTIDHIIPQANGGSDYIRNLQALDSKLNSKLGGLQNRDNAEPKKTRFDDHGEFYLQ